VTLYPYVSEETRTAAGPIAQVFPNGSRVTFEVFESPIAGASQVAGGWLDASGSPLDTLTSTGGNVRAWREDVRDLWIAQAGAPASQRVPFRYHSTMAVLERLSGSIPTLDGDGHVAAKNLPIDGAESLDAYLDARALDASKLTGTIPEALTPSVTDAATVSPSGAGWSVSDRVTVMDAKNATYNAIGYPSIVKIGTREYVVAAGDGHDIATTPSATKTRIFRTTDAGGSWTHEGAAFDDATKSLNFSVTKLASGRLIGSGQQYDISTGQKTNRTNPVYASDDNGKTWTLINASAATGAISAPITELPDGTLILPTYSGNYNTTGSGKFAVAVTVSTDSGDTWSQRAVIQSATVAYAEPVFAVEGNILWCWMRSDNTTAVLWRSDDWGYTWIDSGVTLSDSDSPVHVTPRTGGGWLMLNRTAANPRAREVYREADAAFTNITSPIVVAAPDQRTTYAAIVEASPGHALVVWGEEESTGAYGSLFARYVTRGNGLTPSGMVTTVRPSRLRSIRPLPTYWDTFQRPDTTAGLGESESVVRWDGSNELCVVSGYVQNTYTDGNTYYAWLPALTSENMEVSAELRFTASAEQDVGVIACYLDTSNYICTKFVSGKLIVTHVVAGTATDIAQTMSATPTAGAVSRQTVTLAVRSGQIMAYHNDVCTHISDIASATWAAMQSAQWRMCGIRSKGASANRHNFFSFRARSLGVNTL